MKTQQIVLAKLVEDVEVIRPGQPDIGIRAKVKQIMRPVSLMWLNEGTDEDVQKANKYASQNGYTVYTFNPTVSDPLEKARKLISK